MATYADMFEYSSFFMVMNTCTVEYKGVTLLKDMCRRKAGAKIDKIVLDPKTGKFSVPRAPAPAPHPPPVPVEFKGVHTRFESESESESESEPKPKKKRSSTKKKDITVFKVYSGRKIHKVSDENDEAFETVTDSIVDILGMYELKNHFSVNGDGCIVVCGIWDEFDTKTRHKTESGTFSFKRIAI